MFAGEVIRDLSKIDALVPAWDELAVANQMPLMAPACVLTWWRHIHPEAVEPHIVAVRDGDTLMGLAPLYVSLKGVRSVGLPCGELGGRLGPLAAVGREREVAAALARTLAETTIGTELVRLEGVPQSIDWVESMREQWPGRIRPVARRYLIASCPKVTLGVSEFDEWLSGRSPKFRAEMRRLRRHFDAAGGTVRLATVDTLSADLELLMALHISRWRDRGGSKLEALGPNLVCWLGAMGEALLAKPDRFTLCVLEVAGEPAGAQLYLPAGGRVQYIAAGWDDRFAKLKPTMIGMLAEIERAISVGSDCFDMGTGDQHYKLRFADDDDPVVSSLLVPPHLRSAVALVRTAPLQGRIAVQNALKRRLTDRQLQVLRQAVHRVGRSRMSV